MKLKKLKLVNFRNHRMSELNFTEKINFVFGPNGSGKTSILDAISWLLTGRNVRTSKSGSGSNDLITFGEGMALVEGEFEDIGNVTRTIPHSIQVNDRSGNITEQQAGLMRDIGISEEKLYASINSSEFTSLSPKDKKNFLFDLMDLRVSIANIRSEFLAWARENSVRSPAALFDKYIGSVIDIDFSLGPRTIDLAYDKIVTERKIIKRRIKELEIKVEVDPVDLHEGVTIDSEDIIRQDIENMNEREKEIISRKSEYNTMMLSQKKIAEAKVAGRSIESLHKDLENCGIKIQHLNEELVDANFEIGGISRIYHVMKHWNGECPVFPKKLNIKCNINDEQFKIVLEDYERKNTLLEEKIRNFSYEISKNKEVRDNIHSQIALAGRGISKEMKEIAVKELARLALEYDAVGLQDELRAINIDMRGKKVLLTKILAEKARDASHSMYRNELAAIKTSLKDIDILANGFGPNGVKTIILNKVIRPIRDRVSERMRALSRDKYDMDLKINGDDLYIMVSSDGIEREFKFLSSSEQIRVQIVIQDVINDMTGLQFLIIDDVDRLDKDSRKALLRLLKVIEDEYDTIIALCTGEAFSMDDEINVINLG